MLGVGALVLAVIGGGPSVAVAPSLGSADVPDPRVPTAAPVLVAVPVGPEAGGAPGAPGATEPGAPLAPEAVDAALRPLLRGGALGSGRTPSSVVDVLTGEVLYSASDDPTVPASTMKLVTAASVLDSLGPDERLRTRAVLVGEGTKVPRVVVIGAGDPSMLSTGTRIGGDGSSLRPTSMEQLASSTARALALRGITRVKVGYDDSLFTGPAMHPSWAASFPALGIVAPVSSLRVDEGRSTPGGSARVADPAARAGAVFADELSDAGVTVRGEPKDVTAPDDVPTLAFVESPPVGMLVERMLSASDNDFAEALGRLGAAASGEPASFKGVAARARSLLAELGIDRAGARFADASGLSRGNRLAPATLTDLLMVTSSGYGALHSGLPVAGASGSLEGRFRTAEQVPARGVVRAKTGTLTSVVGLAGYASRPDGRLVAFTFADDSAPRGALAARSALDSAVAALVACDCAAPADPEPTASSSP